jgi:hypothetical protein
MSSDKELPSNPRLDFVWRDVVDPKQSRGRTFQVVSAFRPRGLLRGFCGCVESYVQSRPGALEHVGLEATTGHLSSLECNGHESERS